MENIRGGYSEYESVNDEDHVLERARLTSGLFLNEESDSLKDFKDKEIIMTRSMTLMKKHTDTPYTREDLEMLARLLEGVNNFEDPVFKPLCDIEDALQEQRKNGFVEDTLHMEEDENFTEKYVRISFMQFLILYHKKVFLFLTRIPLNDVVLYYGDPLLCYFADWRIKINK